MPAAIQYPKPRRIWVDDGHVFAEGHDGVVLWMTPEVAIAVGRLLSEAGTESLINRIMSEEGGVAATRTPAG